MRRFPSTCHETSDLTRPKSVRQPAIAKHRHLHCLQASAGAQAGQHERSMSENCGRITAGLGVPHQGPLSHSFGESIRSALRKRTLSCKFCRFFDLPSSCFFARNRLYLYTVLPSAQRNLQKLAFEKQVINASQYLLAALAWEAWSALSAVLKTPGKLYSTFSCPSDCVRSPKKHDTVPYNAVDL